MGDLGLHDIEEALRGEPDHALALRRYVDMLEQGAPREERYAAVRLVTRTQVIAHACEQASMHWREAPEQEAVLRTTWALLQDGEKLARDLGRYTQPEYAVDALRRVSTALSLISYRKGDAESAVALLKRAVTARLETGIGLPVSLALRVQPEAPGDDQYRTQQFFENACSQCVAALDHDGLEPMATLHLIRHLMGIPRKVLPLEHKGAHTR